MSSMAKAWVEFSPQLRNLVCQRVSRSAFPLRAGDCPWPPPRLAKCPLDRSRGRKTVRIPPQGAGHPGPLLAYHPKMGR